MENSNVDYRKIVAEHLSLRDMLDGLCEELAELIQAVQKFKRTMPGSRNITPVTAEQASEMVSEELSDILAYLDLLGWLNIDTSENPKWQRWANRLGGAEEVADDVVAGDTAE